MAIFSPQKNQFILLKIGQEGKSPLIPLLQRGKRKGGFWTGVATKVDRWGRIKIGEGG
jgi:hypothetical protein